MAENEETQVDFDPTPIVVPCSLGCGESVYPHNKDTWKQVTGYVGGPRKDSMRLREDTGKFAHDACVAKLRDGQTVDQPSMFEE